MAQLRKLHLFNCDRTYKLDAFEGLLNEMKAKLCFDSVEKHYFTLAEMSEMTDNTIPKLEMDMAFFVVHAHESRLSINEDNAGIGYAKIYRALLEATEGKVIIIIGGDDNYENEDEEDRVVISRWARRKISSQFRAEFLDGSKSFIFSWNKKHRAIHVEALLHYFDARKKGQKFEYQPKPKQPVVVQSAKTNETSEYFSSNAKPREDSHTSSRNTVKGRESSSFSDSREAEQRYEDLAILCCNVADDSTEVVINVFHDIAPKLNLPANPVFENRSPDKIKEYLMNVHLKACVLVVDGKTVKDVYKNLTEQKEEYRGLLETAVKKAEKVIILICGDCSLQPGDEEIVNQAIEELVIRKKKGFIAWLKNGRLCVDPGVLVRYLMSTSPTSQPNAQNNYLKASQEKNIDAPGSGAECLQRNPPDRKQGHCNNAPNMQQPTPHAASTTQPYDPPAVNDNGEPVLLRSLLHYGRISDRLEDRQLWDPTFTVPDQLHQILFQQYQDTPATGVTIVRGIDGALRYSIDPQLIEVSRSRYEGIKMADNERLMLKTRIVNGQVSFKESDVQFRHGTWQIPQNIVDSLATKSGDLYIIYDGRETLRMVVKEVGRVREAFCTIKKTYIQAKSLFKRK